MRRVELGSSLPRSCSSPPPHWPPRPSRRLERESVEEALALLGLTIDASPEGKVIGHVDVVNQEVFSPHDWRLQLPNVFHRTTRSGIIERELLLAPGQRWNATLVDESVRNLQAPPPLFIADGTRFAAPQSSVVAIVPVVSPVSSTVDVLAVTRDLWSLRFNTDFQFQKNSSSPAKVRRNHGRSRGSR